jgi:ribosomal protein L21E
MLINPQVYKLFVLMNYAESIIKIKSFLYGLKILNSMKKPGGQRRKTRSLFRKHVKDKGKISLRNYLAVFKKGDKVALNLESGVQKGMYHPMFYGKIGLITDRRGKCY